MSRCRFHALWRAGLLWGLAYLVVAGPDRADGQFTEESRETSETRYGAHVDRDGWVHFVVYSPEATAVKLALFDGPDAQSPAEIVPLARSGDDWKIRIRGPRVGAGLLYLYQAEGPLRVDSRQQFGLMFNPQYLLGDPYAYCTQNVCYSRLFSETPLVDLDHSVYAGGGKSVVYDHTRDPSPGHVLIPRTDLIIYELHVQDFTARIQSLDPAKRGTYLGLAQSGLKTAGGLAAGIDHLVELGVTAVELMPVIEFDEETGNAAGRLNHWGYMTASFFAPEARYAARPMDQVVELKTLVDAFHQRGIAVFLDVVYNHTAEQSPWIDARTGRLAAKYYNFLGLCGTEMYSPTADGRFFRNNTGTGNDVAFQGSENTYSKRLVRDSLAHWHRAYGVDGFRFDLARILADSSADAADWTDNDPRFAAAHLHAEPWDLGGQWYDFMDNYGWSADNNRWSKWIGKYRDKIRRFSKSTLNNRTAFKQLIEGYGSVSDGTGMPASTRPWRSINFLAVHDGYTLRDTVYYNDDDGSQNCWDSGNDENLRREREKLMLGVLFTSQGVPLIFQGDEFGATKAGAVSQEEARNSYNSESTTGDANINHVNWLDWRLKEGDNSESPQGPRYGRELFHWTKDLIALRKAWTHFRRESFPRYVSQSANGQPDSRERNDGRFTYAWEGPVEGSPSQLGVVWWGLPGEPDLLVIYNEAPEEFTIGSLADWSQGDWKILARSWYGDEFDFADLTEWQTSCPAAGNVLTIKGRSLAILISDND